MEGADSLDMILTTIPLPHLSQAPETEVLLISPILSSDDINLINDYLYRDIRSFP